MGPFKTSGAAHQPERPGHAVGAGGQLGLTSWLFGGRAAAPPPPSVEDVASTFFTVKGRSPAAGPGGEDGRGSGDGGSVNDLRPTHENGRSVAPPESSRLSGTAGGRGHTRKVAGPWRPGAAAVSPGLGPEEERGG